MGLASFYAASVIPVVAFRMMEFLSVGIVILLASATFVRDKQIWIFLLMLCAHRVYCPESILSLGSFDGRHSVTYEPDGRYTKDDRKPHYAGRPFIDSRQRFIV